jgi:hypothetical protein
MKASSSVRQAAVLGLALTLPAAAGCASRAAPFNDLDQAQVTILKLQGQPAPAPGVPGTQPGQFPVLPIPGLTPEQQAQLQQGAQQLGQAVGQMIPGLPIPGLPGATPVQQPQQTFNGFVVLGSTPVADEETKDKLLDIFGDEDSFNRNVGPCFTPGMGVVFSDPTKGNIELMVSFSCNQVQGNGFRWPHPANGMTPDTSNDLRMIYQQMFMQPPPMQGS